MHAFKSVGFKTSSDFQTELYDFTIFKWPLDSYFDIPIAKKVIL